MFPRIRKGTSLCEFDWKKNPEKGVRQRKVRDKKNSFEIHVTILKYVRNLNLPFKKDFKFPEILTKTSFFLYVRDRPKNSE